MHEFLGATVNDLFVTACRGVLRHGRPTAPRAHRTLELIGVHLQLDQPRCRLVDLTPHRVINPAFAAAEAVWILSGSDDPWIMQYNQRLHEFTQDGRLLGAYGPRLRAWAGHIDQLDHVRTLLIADPDTRRAVIQLYDPQREATNEHDVPCTLGFRFFLREGRLDMHTTMRSQDLWLGFCYDVFTFSLLHELMAGWVGAQLGVYHHWVDSLHLYATHLESAAALPIDVPASRPMPPLSVPFADLDPTLEAVAAGTVAPDSPWWGLAAAMRSYRLWTTGDHPAGRDTAGHVDGPLRACLSAWYDQLSARAAHRPAVGSTP